MQIRDLHLFRQFLWFLNYSYHSCYCNILCDWFGLQWREIQSEKSAYSASQNEFCRAERLRSLLASGGSLHPWLTAESYFLRIYIFFFMQPYITSTLYIRMIMSFCYQYRKRIIPSWKVDGWIQRWWVQKRKQPPGDYYLSL